MTQATADVFPLRPLSNHSKYEDHTFLSQKVAHAHGKEVYGRGKFRLEYIKVKDPSGHILCGWYVRKGR